ncbi:MAG: hypothetical protein U9N31_06445 [Candidatus Marinimicrobia bacterium]|nr:hypothetical protein [Candidatus Neomarinimicrobiota bacterium]
MVKNIFRTLIISYVLYGATISAQAKLDGQFYEYATYYMSNIDVQTGESDVPFFRYRIYSDAYPIYARVWFRASLLSPSLGIDSRTTLVELETSSFQMKADISLDNRNFTSGTTSILDEGNPPNVIPVYIQMKESLNPSEFESLISAVMTTGQLADGEYQFELKLFSGSSELDLSLSDQDSKTIIVESPSGINLESPGGELADTSFNLVYTTYPIFNWNKGYCRNCETYIRVAEFKVGYHSSTEEAMRDERTLPFNQSELWLQLDDVSTYQYPISGTRSLDYGKIYVWQVKTRIPTTGGLEDQVSPIYAFKVADPSQTASPIAESTVIQQLRQAIGEDQFNALFGPDSPLEGFKPTGNISLNKTVVDQKTLQQIFQRFANKEITVNSIEVEN